MTHSIAIVGPGRLGRSLYQLLHPLTSVSLVARGQRIPICDVVLLTVPDNQIEVVAEQVPTGPCVIHCSGATDLAPVAAHTEHGSFHPLMSFPGPEHGLPTLTNVPVALAGTPRALDHGRAIAKYLGLRPVNVPGDRRLYHAAAVMAGNFATVLLAEAGRVLTEAGVEDIEARAMLAPLVSGRYCGSRPAQSS